MHITVYISELTVLTMFWPHLALFGHCLALFGTVGTLNTVFLEQSGTLNTVFLEQSGTPSGTWFWALPGTPSGTWFWALPGTRYVQGYVMGWALAIPVVSTRYTHPVYPPVLPHPGYTPPYHAWTSWTYGDPDLNA